MIHQTGEYIQSIKEKIKQEIPIKLRDLLTEDGIICDIYGFINSINFNGLRCINPCCLGAYMFPIETIYCSSMYKENFTTTFCKNYNYTTDMIEQWKEYEKDRDNVIPPFFNPNDFTFSKNKKKAILFLGRIQYWKGIHEVFKLSKLIPEYDFWIAGEHKDYDKEIITIDNITYDMKKYSNVIMFGYVDASLKRNLLANAEILIQPSQYFEPFGFNIIEAYLSGCFVIVPFDNSFSEIVTKDTGIFYNNIYEIQSKLHNFKIDYDLIYKEGMKYTEEIIYEKYMKYFKKYPN